MSLEPEGEIAWLSEVRVGGELSFRVGRQGRTIVADWPGVARAHAEAGAAPQLTAAPGADPRVLAKLERGALVAMARQLRGELALHGASVAMEGRAVLILGASGAGKSTLAAALCGAGAALLADDVSCLDRAESEPGVAGYAIAPTERHHWLTVESIQALALGAGDPDGKEPVAAPRTAHEPARLVALVALAFDEAVSTPELRRLRGRAAFAPALASAVRFVVDDPGLLADELEQLVGLCRRVPCYLLVRPRKLDQLDACAAVILDLARAPS